MKKNEPYHVKAGRLSAGNPVIVHKPDMFPEQEKALRSALGDSLTAGNQGRKSHDTDTETDKP